MLIIYAAIAVLVSYALLAATSPLKSCRSCAGTGLRPTRGGRVKLCRRCRGTRYRVRAGHAGRNARRRARRSR